VIESVIDAVQFILVFRYPRLRSRRRIRGPNPERLARPGFRIVLFFFWALQPAGVYSIDRVVAAVGVQVDAARVANGIAG
jgi:hypothetical protein